MLSSQPGYIGDIRIKNRIAMAPMISNLANPDGSTNENHIKYLEARARGGAGLIITEYTYVDAINARGSRNELGAFSSQQVPKLKRITESIHKYGTAAFMQLVHAGGKALQDENVEGPMAPSGVDYMGRIPREMTDDDIERVIRAFERAASIVKSSRFDGIEIHGAHGYLMHEFLSPTLNIRSDRYGGSFEKRLKVPQAVIDAAREASGIPVGIRLSLYEDDPDGYDANYGLKVAESLHNIDYVHFSAGNFAPPGSSASFYYPRTHVFNRLPRKPGITTMIVGSITNSTDVEKALEKCDFVSIARGMLADAAFASKVSNSKDPLRPCIRCNQGCRDLAFGEVRCTVNPDVGYERSQSYALHGEVSIIGAGVQGLEAALYAAKSGLKVTLYEEKEWIGGQIRRISDPFKREAFLPLLDYYESALKKLGVEVILGSRFSGKGIYCTPPVLYPEIPDDASIIESNVYEHHDSFLEIANRRKIKIGTRSLDSMDRSRKPPYIALAKDKGIEFVDAADFDFSLIINHQYDMGTAMQTGRGKVAEFISSQVNEFL